MDPNGDALHGGWFQQGVWAVVAVVGSVLLGNACIVLGGLLAMGLESGSGATAGRAIGAIALALMVAAYSLLLVLIMRAVTSRWTVPPAVWLALGVYPVVWGVLVLSSPGGPFAITLVVVTGAGAVLAWLVVERRSGRAAKTVVLASLGVVVLILTTACATPTLTGKTATKEVALKPVTTVSINDGTLRIRQGTPTSLTVRTDKAVERYLVTRQKDGALELGVPDDSDIRSYVFAPMPANSPIEFTLTTDSIDRIHLGGGTVLVDGFRTDKLLLDANLGSANIANIDVDEWRCEMVGGVADVRVSGVAGLSSSTNSSGSHYDDSALRDR